MANRTKRPTVDVHPVRVEVLVASMFRHDGAYVRPGDRLMLMPDEAADLIAMHFVQLIDARPLHEGGVRRPSVAPPATGRS